MKDFRVHDLRRTVATNMAQLGVDRTVLGKLLNHKGLSGDGQVTAIYDRHSYTKEKEKALRNWELRLYKIQGGDSLTPFVMGGLSPTAAADQGPRFSRFPSIFWTIVAFILPKWGRGGGIPPEPCTRTYAGKRR